MGGEHAREERPNEKTRRLIRGLRVAQAMQFATSKPKVQPLRRREQRCVLEKKRWGVGASEDTLSAFDLRESEGEVVCFVGGLLWGLVWEGESV